MKMRSTPTKEATLGCGIDLVAVERFKKWVSFTDDELARVFTDKEIKAYRAECHEASDEVKSSYLAARYAAKEAFYKAFSSALVMMEKTAVSFPLLFLCRHVSVEKKVWGVPELVVDWQAFEKKVGPPLPELYAYLSLSHERKMACAMVVLIAQSDDRLY